MTNSDCLAILCRQINHDAEFVELPAKSLGLWQGWESVSHLHLSPFSLPPASFILLIPFPFMYYTFFFINLFNYSGTLCLSFPICPPPLLLHPSCCSSCICWDIWPVVLVLHVLFPVDVICSLCQAWSQFCLQDANIMNLSLAPDIHCLA